MLFKVADVVVSAETVNASQEDILDLTENYVNETNGKNLIFVNEKTIKSDLENLSPYLKVESVKKVFPNKIEVTVKERAEAYAIFNGGSYYVLDDELFCVAKKSENVSNIDGNRHVLIDVSVSDYSVTALQVGKQFTLSDEVSNNTLQKLLSTVKNCRNNVLSLNVKVKENSFFNRQIKVVFIEGVEIILDRVEINALEKFLFAYSYYQALSDKSYALLTLSTSSETGEFIIS